MTMYFKIVSHVQLLMEFRLIKGIIVMFWFSHVSIALSELPVTANFPILLYKNLFLNFECTHKEESLHNVLIISELEIRDREYSVYSEICSRGAHELSTALAY